jgi:hypothetical protein
MDLAGRTTNDPLLKPALPKSPTTFAVGDLAIRICR